MAGNTYRTRQEGEQDKAQLQALLTALTGQDRALCFDDCVAWQILGKHGNIYTWGNGKDFVLYVRCHSVRAWTFVKKSLAFCRVTQDGDDEGCLRLDHLPGSEEAEAIRAAVGLRKRRLPETGDNLRQHQFKPAIKASFSSGEALKPPGGSQVA